jgi:hypothetical protein
MVLKGKQEIIYYKGGEEEYLLPWEKVRLISKRMFSIIGISKDGPAG